MGKYSIFHVCIIILCICESIAKRNRPEDKTKCPKVKAIRNFDLQEMLGNWFIIEYYASSEEALSYRCMRAEFSMPTEENVNMNFTYSFTDDPMNELLIGNISWVIPNPAVPAHWTHSEDTYEGVYNTYVLDSDYTSWALLMHCAEKSKVPRYLSSFVMSREPSLGKNVVSYLRDKLPRYDIDLSYMFDMQQNDCNSTTDLPPSLLLNRPSLTSRRHPMKHIH
ncbi:lipocalin/cytosolic fatty acid-binding protein Karl [Leptinotarsa decemlineata]|uniref:lipocalin/cytosolic fatty acid-binding protein Karl n=1 Tax=Leptinotarsa decemlineata TaxID=7539 RepID=UPI003D30B238